MANDLVETLFQSAAFFAFLGVIVGGFMKLRENRQTNLRQDGRDVARELSAFRVAAHNHLLGYDLVVRQALIECRSEIDRDREARGEQPKQWAPLPDPREFPLFPDQADGSP